MLHRRTEGTWVPSQAEAMMVIDGWPEKTRVIGG